MSGLATILIEWGNASFPDEIVAWQNVAPASPRCARRGAFGAQLLLLDEKPDPPPRFYNVPGLII